MADDLLDPSELGTKEYWQHIYKTELQNFNEFGDIGEIWFGAGTERRIIQWICQHQDIIPHTSNIIDLGCGNGSLLISLAKKKFLHLTGVDYSEEAVALARNVSAEEDINIKFQQVDILEFNSELQSVFDVVLDKGTFDAISLMKDSTNSKRIYKETLCKLFRVDAVTDQKIFIIASCNWTKDELIAFFAPEFQYFDELDAPSLQFGGKVGKNTSGYSMEPTIKPGQYLLTDHLSVRKHKIKKGDIVVFTSPVKPSDYSCKRLTGVEGDIINGKTVPKGYVWVEGDNDKVSFDSRKYGPIPYGLLNSKVIFRVWPIYTIGTLPKK